MNQDIKTQLLNLISKLPDGQVTREGLLEVLEDKPKKLKKPTDLEPWNSDEVMYQRVSTLARLWQFASQVETVPSNKIGYGFVFDNTYGHTHEIIIDMFTLSGMGLLPRFETREAAQLVLSSLDDEDIRVLRGEI